MLRPDSRSHLLELLRPPAGFDLDQAVGTTFSLDLFTALTVPLAFALFDWEHDDGRVREDPLALLEALRRYGDKLTLFCQAGRIRLPKRYPALVAWLEASIYEVTPEDPTGVFHPKVWALRYTGADEGVCYRLLCLTRNLTFDRCWDTAVVLDGLLTDRELAISSNHPLGDFFAEVPKLAQRALPEARRKAIARMADELRRVRFTLPECFESVQFWHGGLSMSRPTDCLRQWERALVIAPFLSDDLLSWFFTQSNHAFLVSRLESLRALQPSTLNSFSSVYTLQPNVESEDVAQDDEAGPGEVLEGLHAKIFICDRGWNTSVFTGSFNATMSAFYHNVEFMVELVGKKSRFGVKEFLSQSKGETKFSDLLSEFNPVEAATRPDEAQLEWEKLIEDAQRAIAAAASEFRVTVQLTGDLAIFDQKLQVAKLPNLPAGVTVRVWPITIPASSAAALATEVVFPRLTNGLLTPFIAFEVTAQWADSARRHCFVLNLPLEGAPPDRFPKLLAALLADKEQLLRYLLFMLASGSESDADRTDLVRVLLEPSGESRTADSLPFLFETLIRTLHRNPSQIDRVARLLDDLGQSGESANLLSEDFRSIWNPIWRARQKLLSQ